MTMRILLLLLMTATGCATMHPVAHAKNFQLEPFGEANEARERTDKFHDTMKNEFATRAVGEAAGLAAEVKVFDFPFPEGVSVESNGMLSATSASGYTVLAHFRFAPKGATTVAFAEYDSTAARVGCGINVVLTWATALVWQLVPVSYPCVVVAKLPGPEAEGFIRVATKAAGGDTAIVTHRELDGADLFGAEGYFLRSPEATPASDGS